MTRNLTKRKRWQHAAIIGGTAATAAAIALPGALAAGPPAPFFEHGTNGVAGSDGAAKQIDEGAGGQGALLTSVGSGYGNVGVNGGDGTAKTFGALTDVETEFNVTQGTCVGGSPRWVFHVSNPSNPKDTHYFWVYFDNTHAPSGGCDAGTQQDGNLIGGTTPQWYVDGSNTAETYGDVNSQYGSYVLKNIEVEADSGWAQDNTLHAHVLQVLLQNLKVNNASYFKLPS